MLLNGKDGSRWYVDDFSGRATQLNGPDEAKAKKMMPTPKKKLQPKR